MPVFNLLIGWFWGFFTKQGRHVAPIAVNLAWRRGPKVPSFMPNLTQSVQCLGCRSPKSEIFTEIWSCGIQTPTGAYHLRDFQKICRVCNRFSMRQLLKFGWICSRGYGVMGVSSWRCKVIPKLSAPPSGETMRHTPKVLEVQERARGPLSPCQVWWGSDFTRHVGVQKRFWRRSIGEGL